MVYTDPNQLSKADSLERYYLSEEEEDDQEQACESKLVVKLKLPKFDGESRRTKSLASMEEVDDENNNFNFYCYECKRGFNSGKAFGGHRSSAHVQARKDYYRSKKQVRPRDSSDDVEDSTDGVLKRMENKCKICKKVFQNRKSLYGHMRLHPERSYRGMNPPPPPPPSSFSSQPKKRKRKTCDLDQSPNSCSSSADKPSASSFPSDYDVDVVQPPADASEIPKSGKRIGSFSSQDDHDVNPKMETDFDQSDNFKASIANNDDERKLEEDIKKVAEHLKKKYKCKICYKSFESYRALGGHMSAHNKISNGSSTSSSTRFTLPNNTSSNPNPCFSSSPENNQSISQTVITTNSTTSASHRCNICTKIFSSGQALGGHMRCHNSAKTESSTSSSEHQNIDNNINTSTSGRHRKILDIDLNELPKDDDDPIE